MVRSKGDMKNNIRCGIEMIKTRDIDRLGVSGVTEHLKRRIQGSKVCISVDIDVLDPASTDGYLWH
jgi:agmatinase